ncbi:MAG TPA: asparagine synthase-related protein [Candidatus Saccharimonadales bacterium]|nr:asparagine synthase-related protein [Candidatus Saccharimonadales bacterium]
MSGFAGVVSLDGALPDTHLLERMAQTLAFRGPDGTHITTKPGAGFCFTFLRTGPAPQCPSQPCSLDGNVWLLGDVRLDGRDDLRRKLEQHGDVFPSAPTDEELVLRAWRRWGHDCLPDLMGDFSFLLWNDEARRLLCVRDLMGARPFFYAPAGGWFSFSNTLEVLLLVPQVSPALDSLFIADFLLQELCSDPDRSVYREIRRLPAGHKLEYASDQVRISRYVSLPIGEPLRLKRPKEYIERFQTLLDHAVRDRLPREPSAIFLSGGLDSTSVASVATKIAPQTAGSATLRAYTMECQPLFDDEEGRYASLAAQNLNMPIEILSAASCLPYEGWDEPRWRTPEPCHDPFLRLRRLQYQQIRTHARVALSGYGGDDILTGQAWPYLVYLLRRSHFGTIARELGRFLLTHGHIPPLRGGFRARLRRWFRQTDALMDYPPWLASQFAEEQHLRERWLELQKTPKPMHPFHPEGYSGLADNFWSSVFDQDDAAWTGVPVELRAPLLDQRVLRYLLQLPPVPWCADKELLRLAMHGLLPEEIRSRPKTPLIGDAVSILAASGKWSPALLPAPCRAARTFVDWERLGATLRRTIDSNLWVCLRAASLNYWLKGIENAGAIR